MTDATDHLAGERRADLLLGCQINSIQRRKTFIRGLGWWEAEALAQTAMDRCAIDPYVLLLTLAPGELAWLIESALPAAAAEMDLADRGDLADLGLDALDALDAQ